MATETVPSEEKVEGEFRTGEVVTIVGGHFVHDTFSAFFSVLLPDIIRNLSLSLAAAGSLQFFVQLPAILNPFIGYIADRISLRYFIILAPGVTATLMSVIGLAPSYAVLAMMLLVTGISIAAFHAPAPAMVARVSGDRIGKGMSWFMASGELGRAFGPLLIAWAIGWWTLDGTFRLMFLGWTASVILYWRLRNVPARTEKPQNIRAILPTARRIFIPILAIVFPRAFLIIPMQVYLPTLLEFQGSTLMGAAILLTVWELAGVAGALLGGTLSDRLGRKTILIISMAVSPLLTLIFLRVDGTALFVVLAIHGLFSLSTNPVLLAIVQEHLPNNRAVGNGLFIGLSFLIRPLAAVIIGFLGDTYGLDRAYFWGALIAWLSIPAILFLPELENK